jgi:autotransporter-associated beta strand protein
MVTLTGAGNGVMQHIISGAPSSLTVTKSGAGSWTLSGANTYTGATTISAGTLEISNATALGTSAGTTTISANAALNISGGITVAEPITINGTGVSSGGAIKFTSGNNTYSGAITLGSDSTITSSSGTQIISATIDGAKA